MNIEGWPRYMWTDPSHRRIARNIVSPYDSSCVCPCTCLVSAARISRFAEEVLIN